MDWDAVNDDPYYLGRKLEQEARTTHDPDKWTAFADLKAAKGSYTLAVHGYMSAAALHEAGGHAAAAAAALEKGLTAAMRAGNRDLAVLLTYRLAQIFEAEKNWTAGIAAWEGLGAFCAEKEAHFQAADAYEHAAELMVRAGRSVRHYTAPVLHWENNIRHWEDHGHDHDAVWSQKHIERYKKLFGVAL